MDRHMEEGRTMDILMCGISHKAIAVREQVSFTDTKKMEFQEQLRGLGISNILILSTCNRSEVLCLGHKETLQSVANCYRNYFSLDEQTVLDVYTEAAALLHFYEVCMGLDSALLGEDQILKQVKDAYAFACDSGCAQKPLHKIVQDAMHLCKQLKKEYRLSEHPLTTSYVAMKKLKQEVQLQNQQVLLSGSGEVIKQCIPYLMEEPSLNIRMLVRSQEKQKQMQKEYPKIQFLSFEERYLAWEQADIIITATASPHVLFKKSYIQQDEKERWIFDLALPRDVDPALGAYENLHMYDIDEIQQTLQWHQEQKGEAVQQVKEQIRKYADAQYPRYQEVESEELIRDFQKHLLSMSQDTYRYLEQKLTLSTHEQHILKKTLDYSYLRFLQDWLAFMENSDKEKQTMMKELIQQISGRKEEV